MAHAICPNGHGMWNGDGKVCIDVFRVKYVEEFCKKHPDKIINCAVDEGEYFAIWSIFEFGDPEEEYDVWRCAECKGLSIWNHDSSHYYGYRVTKDISINEDVFSSWEKYFVLDDDAFENFELMMERQELTPIDAFAKFADETDMLKYAYVSNNHEIIVVMNNDGKVFRTYKLDSERVITKDSQFFNYES